MAWVNSIIAALLSGVTGLFLAGFIANAWTSWYHLPSREGQSGYFVVFTAIGGGVAGFALGLITARIAISQFGAGFGKELGAALGAVLVIAGISALLGRMFAEVPPEIEGRDLRLEVEFRFPVSARPTVSPPTAEGKWVFRFTSMAGTSQRAARTGELLGHEARLESGRWIVPAEVFLFTRRGGRLISLHRDGESAGGFLAPLPARPGPRFLEWSAWLPSQQRNGQPWPADRLSYRFRVQKTVPSPSAA